VTAAERVYLALSGGVPDRVPFLPKIWIDLAARLLGEELLEVAGDPRRALEVTARAALDLGLDGARLFHLPPRRLERDGAGRAVELDPAGRLVGWVDEAGGLATHLADPRSVELDDPSFSAWPQFRACEEPFIRGPAEVASLTVPDEAFWELSGVASRTSAAMKAYGAGLALIGDLGTATLSFCASLRGLERSMFDLVDEPALVHALMDRGAEIAVAKARLNLGLGIRILRLNDSAGTMSLISPALWREFVKPRFREIVKAAKDIDPGARVYCHICGDLRPIALDLVETGVDCIAPLDPLGGSGPGALRGLVGEGAALMGGIDTMSFLQADAASLSAEARACILAGGARGGFVLGSGCVVPRGSPRANLEAARDVARSAVYEGGALRFIELDPKERK
jgi:uroporphyrinogen-III decarboxylase